MGFNRDALPDAQTYFEERGLKLTGPGRSKWKTTRCEFHGGSDSMRVNTKTGAWVCMAGCGAKGGDVLAYHMATDGVDFITAAKELGCWQDDGKPAPVRPSGLSARAALELLRPAVYLVYVACCNAAQGVELTRNDREKLADASAQILKILEVAS